MRQSSSRFMDSRGVVFCMMLAFALLAVNAQADRGRVRIDKTRMTPVTDKGTLLMGSLWSPNRNWKFTVPSDALFGQLKNLGLNALHAYVDYDCGGRAWNSSGVIADVDGMVAAAGKNGFYVVITAAGAINKDIDGYVITNDTYYAYLQNFWKTYGPRYANKTHVIYEIMNEPVHWGFPYSDKAVQRHEEIYKYIRSVAPQTHVMLWGAANLSGSGCVSTCKKATQVDWSNASATFHWYSASVSGVNEVKRAGFAISCTEPARECSRGPSAAKSAAQGCINSNISVTWFDGCLVNDGDCNVGTRFKNNFNSWGISWCPDYGTWPKNSATCSSPTDVISPAPENYRQAQSQLTRSPFVLTGSNRQVPAGAMFGLDGRAVRRDATLGTRTSESNLQLLIKK